MTHAKDRQLNADDLSAAWKDYLLNKDSDAREHLTNHYLWLVRYALSSMKLPTYSVLSDEDFIGYGIIGLLDALERFDAARGLKFETFAYHRIKGVVLDEMRKLDWLSRTARRRAQEYLEVSDKLRQEKGRDATSEEIRTRIGASEEEYHDYLAAVAAANISFEVSDIRAATYIDEEQGNEEIADPDWRDLLIKLADEERLQYLTGYLEKLPERKRLVMALYYYEELNFKEIGETLGVTESRVCQIHTTIIKDLRERFRILEFP